MDLNTVNGVHFTFANMLIPKYMKINNTNIQIKNIAQFPKNILT